MRIGLFILAFAFGAASAQAQEKMAAKFDVRLLGVKIAEFRLNATTSQSTYNAKATFATTGAAGALKRLHADVSAKGRLSDANPSPQIYSESIDNGKRVTNLKVSFAGNTPKIIEGEAGSSVPAANPRGLRGSVDPLTGLFIILRDQPAEDVCRVNSKIFDGHRLARITLNQRRTTEKGVTCTGEYLRVDGYSDSELRRKRTTFTVDYEAKGTQMRAMRVRLKTSYGKAALVRR